MKFAQNNLAWSAHLVMAFFLGLALFLSVCSASELSITGSYKSLFTAYDPANYSLQDDLVDSPLEAQVQNRTRVKLFWQSNRDFSVEIAYELVPALIQESYNQNLAQLLPETDRSEYRFHDLHATLYPDSGTPESSFSVGQNLDRLLCTWTAEYFDLTIGRQAISFGSARIINPTDILTPFSYQTVDTEDRPGVDAIRLKIPTGAMSELDLGFVCGPDGHHSENATFIRARFPLTNNDLTFLACLFKDNLMAGFDLARSLGGAGLWLETAYTWIDVTNDNDTTHDLDYFRLSMGLDYNLLEDMYGYIEYHYNGPGETGSDRYLSSLNRTAFSEGNVYLLGKQYLAPGLNYMLTPLLTADLAALINLGDPSALLSASLEYSLTQDVYIRLGTFIATGQSARFETSSDASQGPVLEPRSEFGLYPTYYYTSIRAYF
ncbi:hypothetical protein JXQ70_08425 [bacterium]|nr:hypothetical protein [bacterium]